MKKKPIKITYKRHKWIKPYPKKSMHYIIRDIVARRLPQGVASQSPKDEDFEYMVAWEGYSSDENTWEPYSHVKISREKILEFQKQLASNCSGASEVPKLCK